MRPLPEAKATLGGANLPVEASQIIMMMASSFRLHTKVYITNS